MLQVTSASQAGKGKGRWLQEDIENFPASIVARKEYKQRKQGMQTHGENPLTALITSGKYVNERELLKENKSMLHESLNLEFPKYGRKRDEPCKSVTIGAAPLDDMQENHDVATAALQNAEAQVRETCNSSSYETEGLQ
jgi:hypothetical protein